MKVSRLIELLQEEDPEAEVKFAYDYGDYSHTQVAATVDDVEAGYVTFSEYHRMDSVVEPDDEETDIDPEGDTPRRVIILS